MAGDDAKQRLKFGKFWDDLDAYALTLEPSLARAFAEVITQLRQILSDTDVERMVATQDFSVLLGQADLRGVQLALRDAVDAAATRALESGVLGTVQVRFDLMHPYVIDALRDFESKAIASLDYSIKSGVLHYLERQVPYGTNPIEIARGIRDVIGLPDNLVQAGANYRRMLLEGDPNALKRAIRDKRFDATVLRGIQNGGLPKAQVDQQMERWYARALKLHSETIARTASMDAVNVGNRLAWSQLIADEKVDVNKLRRWWVVARDERVCPICRPVPVMNPLGVGFNELFNTPEGQVIGPTLHYRCRCVVWTEQVET